MPNRDVWKYGSSQRLHELLSSALITLLLPGSEGRSVYFASPWMSDFNLFENGAREVSALFPVLADRATIRFVEFLKTLSDRHDVRIITARNRVSDAFVDRLRGISEGGAQRSLRVRISPQETHEKGILAPAFYIDGSMNITHMGVHVNGEKIAYHADAAGESAARIASAYFEFDRRWALLATDELRW